MNYHQAVESYLCNCKTSGKSYNTINSYNSALRILGAYLTRQNILSVADVSTDTLIGWKAEVAASVSPSSLRLYLTIANGFFSFCHEAGLITANPYKERLMQVAVKDVDRKDMISHIISEQEFASIMLSHRPMHMHRNAVARNKAIIALLVTSGIRCESLCRLTHSDLDYTRRSIRIINAKGGKNDEILYSSVAFAAVQEYLASGYHPPEWSETDTLFGFVDGSGIWTPYSRSQLSNIVESSIRSFVGRPGFRSHAMRHTFASFLSNNGMSDGEVSVLLMHADGTGAKVTSKYIKRDNSALFEKADAIFNSIVINNVKQEANHQ
jgi:integrase/recombinase XerD